MGTRHFILVYYRGRYCVAQYGQYDGYVEDAGILILQFLLLSDNVSSLKTAIDTDSVYEVTPEVTRVTAQKVEDTTRELRRFRQLHNASCHVSNTISSMMMTASAYVEPSLAATTGPKILYLIANASPAKPLPLRLEMGDWSGCEWIYVVAVNTIDLTTSSPRDTGHLPQIHWPLLLAPDNKGIGREPDPSQS